MANASAGTNVATLPAVGICVSRSSHWCAPQPAGPGAPKIWLHVTTVHLFDHIAGILCWRAHRGSPPFPSISQGYMFLSIICKENAINYSWFRNHHICFLPSPSFSFLQNFKSLLPIPWINSKEMSCRLNLLSLWEILPADFFLSNFIVISLYSSSNCVSNTICLVNKMAQGYWLCQNFENI